MNKEKHMNDLVSVNVTTYNRSNLLKRSIESIQRQTYQNLEIIIVDDCSEDNTEEIVKFYQKQDKRIVYLKHNKNLGNAYTRNTALKNCHGYYVAFMDDDDEWIDNDKITKQLKIFKEHKSNKLGIVCSGIIRKTSVREIVEQAKEPKDIIATVLQGGLIHNSTAMVLRDIMLEVNGFDESVPRGVDSEFFRRLIVKYKYQVFFMKEITCKYYEDSPNRMTSTSISGIKKDIESNFLTLKKYQEYFKEYKEIKNKRKINIIRMILYVVWKEKNIKYLKKLLELLWL